MPEVHLSHRALFDIEDTKDIDSCSIKKQGKRVATKILADLFAGAARLGDHTFGVEVLNGSAEKWPKTTTTRVQGPHPRFSPYDKLSTQTTIEN